MRAALCLLGFLLASCGGLGQPDHARQRIDCADSYLIISIPGDYKCEQFAKEGGSAYGMRAYGGTFQTFDIFGKTDDGMGFSLQGRKALTDGYYSPNVDPRFTYEYFIKDQNPITRRAKIWDPLQVVGSIRYMNFIDPNQRQCFGFIHFGGPSRWGFNHVVRGYFCRKAAPFTAEEIAALVSRVGMRDSLSSPLPASMLPKPMLTCALRDGSTFQTTNKPGCLREGGAVR